MSSIEQTTDKPGPDTGRLILLPGLGADERMYAHLGDFRLPLFTPRHLVPEKGESLAAFARRTAAVLDIAAADVVGGSSFGSLVASAIARQMQVRGLVLVAGALDGGTLRPVPGAGLLRLLPSFLLRPLLRSERVLEIVFGPESPEMRRFAWTMLAEAPADLLLYGGRMIHDCRMDGEFSCPVFAIHGSRDPVMAPPPVPGCHLIPGAGHGLAWTHGPEVTEFLCRVLASLGAGRPLAMRPEL